jgi:hypothetical protein
MYYALVYGFEIPLKNKKAADKALENGYPVIWRKVVTI